MAGSFPLIDHIHHLIRAGDKTLSASLRRREERKIREETSGDERKQEERIQGETVYESDLM